MDSQPFPPSFRHPEPPQVQKLRIDNARMREDLSYYERAYARGDAAMLAVAAVVDQWRGAVADEDAANRPDPDEPVHYRYDPGCTAPNGDYCARWHRFVDESPAATEWNRRSRDAAGDS